jgi:hypothetical protein
MRSKEQTDMTEQALPLITFYSGWGVYQQNLVEVIAPLSPEQLALPASSHHWSIGMVAQHIVANRVWWFQGWMGEGSPDLAPIYQYALMYRTLKPKLHSGNAMQSCGGVQIQAPCL